MANFGQRLFMESWAIQRVCASYLEALGIQYDPSVLQAHESAKGGQASSYSTQGSPRFVYRRLEAENPSKHNVERLFEHAWRHHASDDDFLDALMWDGVFAYLFNESITQFGFPSQQMRRLTSGVAVAERLFSGDCVLNLNYDVVFDLALRQARRYFSYAPQLWRDSILVFKPHGSFNLFVNRLMQAFVFGDPSRIRGSYAFRDPSGGVWSSAAGFVPPRLHKEYAQHPIAAQILAGIDSVRPDVVTFWGVGLTDSDVDLLDIYRAMSQKASRVEFINPDVAAHSRAQNLLGVSIQHDSTLDSWLAR
jgi:hypothetical protein